IEPKRERAFTPRERWLYRRGPPAFPVPRAWLFSQSIPRFKGFDVTSEQQTRMRELCEGYITRTIKDPEVARALTPDYPWGCKRPILATTYYEAFNRDNVELVPHAVTSMTPTGIVDATGTEREIDVLILSTGFQPTRFLS